jgi:hypothetical protein
MPNIPESMLKVVKSEKSGNFIILGRLMYASLYTPSKPSKSETDEKKFTYQATLLVPPGTDFSALDAEVDRLFKDNVVEAKRATTKWKRPPVNKTADQGALALYAEDYPTTVRANSRAFDRSGKPRAAPSVVDAKGMPVPADREADETYNGRWARISVNPYWYDNDDKGVSLGLVNVQLLWNDDPLAGGKAKASSDFEPVEGALDDMGELEGFE